MTRRRGAALIAAFLALVGRGAMGCAAGNEPDAAPSPDTSTDASADTSPRDDGAEAGDATAPSTCSADGWCYAKLPEARSFDGGDIPGNSLFSLVSVWIAPDHQAWAVSAAGHVLRWNGVSWTVEHVASGTLRTVWGSSANDVWIAGDYGLLLHGTGSGGALSFQPVSIGAPEAITRIWGTSPTDIWLLADRVYHLTAATANASSPFVPIPSPLPSDGDAAPPVRMSAVWGTASETWFAGVKSCKASGCAEPNRVVAARRSVGSSGAESWETISMAIEDARGVVAGASTMEGLQVLLLQTRINATAFAARVAGDASKLDPKRGAITVVGAHAWNVEMAEEYGQPAGLWGRKGDDLWLVGHYGVIRHFDGSGWQVSRVTLSPFSPLAKDLHAIDALVDEAGERDMWVVGEDVALHRTGKP